MEDSDVRLNILISLAYFSKAMAPILEENQHKIRLFIDSGAFTAYTSGKELTLPAYLGLLEELPIKPWRYFTLDKIGDPEASYKNYEELLRRGHCPVPIFTRGEDPTMLDTYYETSDLVGIGGLVKTPRNTGFVKGIMKHIAGRPVHLLGFTRRAFVNYYRPYSIDSAGWVQGRYGRLSLYMGRGRFRSLPKAYFASPPEEHVAQRIRELGVDPWALSKNEAWVHRSSRQGPVQQVEGASIVRFALDMQKRLGVLYFQVAWSPVQILTLIEAYDKVLNSDVSAFDFIQGNYSEDEE